MSTHRETRQAVGLGGAAGKSCVGDWQACAGLEIADAGSVLFKQDDITQRSAKDRNVGFVFQHFSLLPTLTVREAHQIAVEADGRLRKALPFLASVMVHVDPSDAAGEEHHHEPS